jgi:hypothetical protein
MLKITLLHIIMFRKDSILQIKFSSLINDPLLHIPNPRIYDKIPKKTSLLARQRNRWSDYDRKIHLFVFLDVFVYLLFMYMKTVKGYKI